MDKIDQLAMQQYGKRWSDLSREEQLELKRHPLWLGAAYGTDLRVEDVQRLNTSDSNEGDSHEEGTEGH